MIGDSKDFIKGSAMFNASAYLHSRFVVFSILTFFLCVCIIFYAKDILSLSNDDFLIGMRFGSAIFGFG